MKDISVKALAKINLGLDVVRKREDGYHEVRMVMQTIHLFDRLEISKNTSGEITMETNLSFLPTNENNLVYKAAKLLQDEFAIKDGVHVWLHKYIPQNKEQFSLLFQQFHLHLLYLNKLGMHLHWRIL